MPTLNYRATNFPAASGAALAGDQSLVFAWAELIWAAISVGRAELLHILPFGPFSAFEIVYRSAILFALGLTTAKLVADRLLDVPWLMHLDVYRQQLQPVLQDGDDRPDLVGKTSTGHWVGIESKGRTHGYDRRALTRAKEQVQNLASVSGTALSLRVAVLAHFGGGLLQCAIDDPDEKRRSKPIDLPLSEAQLFEGYYRPLREWLREMPAARREMVRDRPYRVADLPEVDLSVGLQEGLVERPEARDAVGVRQGRVWTTTATSASTVSLFEWATCGRR